MVHTVLDSDCKGFVLVSPQPLVLCLLLLFLGASSVMNWNSDDGAVSAQHFLASEPHRNYLGHLNKSEVVLVHFKYLQMCSTHFMPTEIVGMFCNWWSPCCW